jgi:integrase
MNSFLNSRVIVHKNKSDVEGLRPGQPSIYLSSSERVRLFEEPTLFIFEKYIRNGSSPSINTWAVVADSLKSWFEWMQAVGTNWQDASRQDRLDYRDAYLTSVSPLTGNTYDPKTVSMRMQIVRRFYEFAAIQGWYQGDLASGDADETYGERVPVDQVALAHISRRSREKFRDRDLPKARRKSVIHAFQIADLKSLLQYCGPRAAHPEGDCRPSRDRLFVDFGWVVGLRVEEIHSLTTLHFLNIHPDPMAPFISHSLIIQGKGAKTRQVAVPGYLVEDAIAYIVGERRYALKAGGFSGRTATKQLFVGGSNSTRPGHPLSTRRLQQIVENGCRAIGLTRATEVFDLTTREHREKLVPKHSVHDLRHTAAVLFYHAEVKNGNPEPWKKVQAQLGHEHLETTKQIYLRHVEIFGEAQRFFDVRRMIGLL